MQAMRVVGCLMHQHCHHACPPVACLEQSMVMVCRLSLAARQNVIVVRLRGATQRCRRARRVPQDAAVTDECAVVACHCLCSFSRVSGAHTEASSDDWRDSGSGLKLAASGRPISRVRRTPLAWSGGSGAVVRLHSSVTSALGMKEGTSKISGSSSRSEAQMKRLLVQITSALRRQGWSCTVTRSCAQPEGVITRWSWRLTACA